MRLALVIFVLFFIIKPKLGFSFFNKKTIDFAYFIAKTFFNDEFCDECSGIYYKWELLTWRFKEFIQFLGRLMRNSAFEPYTNGCGSYGIHIRFNKTAYSGFDSCCDQHDLCYQNCQKKKDDCDNTFMLCMRDFCQRFVINSTLYSGLYQNNY